MNCRIKALGPVLVAALALTAAMAPAASAQFTSNKEHTILSGSQKFGTDDLFSAGEGFGGITCENATFSGTSVNKSETTQAIKPTYENCRDSFGRIVDVDNGETFIDEIGLLKIYTYFKTLTYTFTSGASKGSVHLSGEVKLTVTSGGTTICTVTIKSQKDNGVTYTNLGGTKGVEVTTHATNVISTTSGGFFNCGVSNGEHFFGTYDGTAVITGQDTSGAAAEISVD